MTIRSVTVEFLRFGDETGILTVSGDYIRTIGETPSKEIRVPIRQERLNAAMRDLDYKRLREAGLDEVVQRAESIFEAFFDPLKSLLNTESRLFRGGDGPVQIDIVTRANEIAQLPFEILEEREGNLVVTRRIRQPWPPPPLVCQQVPKILFVWAAPPRMEVPADDHRKALLDLLEPFGGERQLVEVEHATLDAVAAALRKDEFTHVHILAHGVKPRSEVDYDEQFRWDEPAPPQVLLALEDDEGKKHEVTPTELAKLFGRQARPEAVTIATCHGGELNPSGSGATLAHAIHNAGVPVVVASQMALTKRGSLVFVTHFLQGLATGRDPRLALRDARTALRDDQRTFYDRIAVVGYVHVGFDQSEVLREREFAAKFRDLKDLSDAASARLGALGERVHARLSKAHYEEIEQVRAKFKAVRDDLTKILDTQMSPRHREEVYGLLANSFKREAEACWQLCCIVTEVDQKRIRPKSRSSLRAARDAYRVAAGVTRDRHWARVQWLVCEAVIEGTLEHQAIEWFTAYGAAEDVVSRGVPRGRMTDAKRRSLEEIGWAYASMLELQLLAPLVGYEEEAAVTRRCLKQLVRFAKRLDDPFFITSTRGQCQRYESWWGPDWGFDEDVVARARVLRELLETAWGP